MTDAHVPGPLVAVVTAPFDRSGNGARFASMYLWHYPLAYGFWPITRGMPWPIALLVVTALTYALAATSWVVVERRFLRARRAPRPVPLSTPS